MAVIYLKHLVHGEKVACGDLEASIDRANGWFDFDPTVIEVGPVVPSIVVLDVPATVVVVSEDAPKDVITDAVPSFLAPIEEVISDLPDNFPGRDALIDAGFLTWASLVDLTDDQLQDIKGVGAVTSKRILDALGA